MPCIIDYIDLGLVRVKTNKVDGFYFNSLHIIYPWQELPAASCQPDASPADADSQDRIGSFILMYVKLISQHQRVYDKEYVVVASSNTCTGCKTNTYPIERVCCIEVTGHVCCDGNLQ